MTDILGLPNTTTATNTVRPPLSEQRGTYEDVSGLWKHADYWIIINRKCQNRLPGSVFGLWGIRIKGTRINEVWLHSVDGNYGHKIWDRHRLSLLLHLKCDNSLFLSLTTIEPVWIGNIDWDWECRLGMEIGNGNGEWEWRLGMEIGNGDWEWRMGMGM